MSSYESLRAAGTSVVCLSPWGDSSPLLLPCIRFRDLVMHSVIAATGGTAAIAAPVMGPISEAVVTTLGDTILVEVGLHTGFELATKGANDLLIEHPVSHLIPLHSKRLETTAVKELTITLKYKHTVEDASLGFFRSSVHGDSSLFASVKDYLAVEKGWFSPYLFASGRRPIIPRSMKPDVVFCHGPFLSGDYKIGETLLNESASVITLANTPPAEPEPKPEAHHASSGLKIPTLSKFLDRSRTPSPEPDPALAVPPAPQPRRLVILVVGLKPHRAGFWTTSQRPSESVIRYQLLNGCPAIVVPAKAGAPLLAWDTLTLEHLWAVSLPPESEPAMPEQARSGFHGIVTVLFEYLDLCVDWERLVLPEGEKKGDGMDEKKTTLKDAVALLVAAAVRSGESKEVKKEVDKERSGIAIWRIP
ncbi:hypothetical protein GLOTRDRAFT_100608 [Gloeophyllum trabeum ATCC 11539]|uniref:Uncharacterized protein n=1 Tax=Gloeophyllum trabeum (strain ATCC 11539 / FP-39264 / Madison 617) TaxID=670483 RepID=S7Q1P0_GLOTA|nr:uncharacterized protein GLOTRDRAFT_100608 [Gloeophyllum trabeum ATCC 11539]EPQ53447.1 hypothetical protein GLOTRDRAFT_100608 [Gloeophyllum trabeum ATCC 11539]